MKSNRTLFGQLVRWNHQLTNSVENHFELPIVFLFHGGELASQLLVCSQHSPHSNKGAHNLDVHLAGAPASQDARQHGNALLREGIRRRSPSAPYLWF